MLGLLWYAELLGLLLMLLSLFRVQHVVLVDYDAFEYGFPFPWIILVSTITPVHVWIPDLPGLIYDLVVWLAVGYFGVFALSRIPSLKRL